eukprot:SAG25_NODE_340_length_9458_cov_4.740571_11_plen_57_part_00
MGPLVVDPLSQESITAKGGRRIDRSADRRSGITAGSAVELGKGSASGRRTLPNGVR